MINKEEHERQMKCDHQSIDCFETYLLILSFCMSKWRTTRDIIEYFDIPQRTAQRYVKQLVGHGYLERNGKTVGTTKSVHHAFKWRQRLNNGLLLGAF